MLANVKAFKLPQSTWQGYLMLANVKAFKLPQSKLSDACGNDMMFNGLLTFKCIKQQKL